MEDGLCFATLSGILIHAKQTHVWITSSLGIFFQSQHGPLVVGVTVGRPPDRRLQGRPVSLGNVSIIPAGPPPAAVIIDSVACPSKKDQSQNSFSSSDKDWCTFLTRPNTQISQRSLTLLPRAHGAFGRIKNLTYSAYNRTCELVRAVVGDGGSTRTVRSWRLISKRWNIGHKETHNELMPYAFFSEEVWFVSSVLAKGLVFVVLETACSQGFHFATHSSIFPTISSFSQSSVRGSICFPTFTKS